MTWAVLLDRDGVINEDVHHLRDASELRLIRGSAEAIRQLNERSIPVIVVTNQSVVARGDISEEQVGIIHQALSVLLAEFGAHIDRFYYCPHHPTEGRPPYRIECECRKPKPGMLHQAKRDFGLDLSRSYFIGDTLSDIQAGEAAGCQTLLVQTGYGTRLWAEWAEATRPQRVAADLLDAVKWILRQEQLCAFI